MENLNIVFIGCGNMGKSLIGGLLTDGYQKEKLTGVDIDQQKLELIGKNFNIETTLDGIHAVSNADVVVLSVKPQSMQNTLTALRPGLQTSKPLLISIAAGIRLKDLERWAGDEFAFVRAMPNTPALIQCSATALFANKNTSEEHCSTAESILRAVGIVIWLENESQLDTVTALSGSGPAYYFLIMEVMKKAAIKLGLSEEQAGILTLETAVGAAKMAIESEYDPSVLREQVTSPGGTTEKALEVLFNGQIEDLFYSALSAARTRSIELADGLGKSDEFG